MATGKRKEFGGIVGTSLLIFLLPAVCFLLHAICNERTGCIGTTLPTLALPDLPPQQSLFNTKSLVVITGWYSFCVVLHLLLPAQHAHGQPLKHLDGKPLLYRLNALPVVCTAATLPALAVLANILNPEWVVANFLALQSSAILLSFVLSVWLYARSFAPSVRSLELAHGGTTGSLPYDFWMGRELNPRVGSLFDVKEFCELTPGMALWLALDVCFLLAQKQRNQLLPAMMATVACHAHYVLDGLWNECSILSTMDITTDGFGFMLAFGDLVWVPFTYSLHCRYLLESGASPSHGAVAAGVMLHLLGYYIFRASNKQKDTFKRKPNDESVKHLKRIETSRGRLLASGWWGLARHTNYFGDWLMGLGWCVACGFESPVPYFYAIYFAFLLAHRERRDDEACRRKHGEGWKRYCNEVPRRIVPFVY